MSSWFGKQKQSQRTLKVVVVHSHSGGKKMWDHLGRHYGEYGTTRLSIVHQRDFTLDSLTKERPDVIVASDPAGAPYQYTQTEVADLSTYLSEGVGRHLLGTYACFYHREGTPAAPHIYDNRGLAALFGFDPTQCYTTTKLQSQPCYIPTAEWRDSVLWHGVGTPYTSQGYSSTQLPSANDAPRPWLCNPGAPVVVGEREKLSGGFDGQLHLVAKTIDSRCVITNWISSSFTSLYVSHMPEYESVRKGRADAQFLYNCFLFLASQGGTISLAHRCMETIVSQIGSSKSGEDAAEASAICALPLELRERLYLATKHSGRISDKRLRDIFGSAPVQTFATVGVTAMEE